MRYLRIYRQRMLLVVSLAAISGLFVAAANSMNMEFDTAFENYINAFYFSYSVQNTPAILMMLLPFLVINYMLDRFVPKGFFDRSGLLFYAMQAFFTMVFGEKRGFGGPFFSWRVYLSDRWDFVCQHLSFDSVEGDDAGRDSKRLCISTKLVVCFLFGHVLQCIVVFCRAEMAITCVRDCCFYLCRADAACG